MSEETLQPWEVKSLREIHDKWYESFYSLIFTPPGEIPQTKGHWTDFAYNIEMADGLRAEYGPDLKIIVVSSRCGSITAEDYDEWLEMTRIGIECAKEEAAYIERGVCSQCGACSLKEAETKCCPSPLGDTGDYSCDGESLWEDQRDAEDNEPNDHSPALQSNFHSEGRSDE